MKKQPSARFTKVVVTLERREDGGLRAYSDDVPGFVLSNRDFNAVIADIEPALEEILSSMWGVRVVASKLGHIGRPDEVDTPEPAREACLCPQEQEYVAYAS